MSDVLEALSAAQTRVVSQNNKLFIEVDPALCKPWKYHNRDKAWLNKKHCIDLIRSIEKNGQIEPILLRRVADDLDYPFEIICGVRRWFACSQIPNRKILAYVIEADDKTCMILMHSENADSQDISEFERAFSFAQQMKSGVFKNQTEMAKAMGLSQSSISKMIQAAEIFEFDWIERLFDNKLEISLRHAYNLSVYLRKEEAYKKIRAEALLIESEEKQGTPLNGLQILKRLLKALDLEKDTAQNTILLENDKKPLIVAHQDKSGKLHISIDAEVKTRHPADIEALCLKTIHEYLQVIPGE
jgi:ParB family chromosome partitioning protein